MLFSAFVLFGVCLLASSFYKIGHGAHTIVAVQDEIKPLQNHGMSDQDLN